MANHKSSKKRIIRNANRALINGARMSRIRTFVKKVETAIAEGDAGVAREALRQAQPEMQRGVSRGIQNFTPCGPRQSPRSVTCRSPCRSPRWRFAPESQSRLQSLPLKMRGGLFFAGF